MTNEEIERTLQQILAVQRELQETQIATGAQIQDLTEQIQGLTNLGSILLNNSAELSQQLRTLTELVTSHENRIQRLERPSDN
ncbi:MAG: hypothetical protein N5P05_001148 [Chroococcopsis gigantea SAG 12.99]|jgi:chromosome segregation ATPase|nr:hypothetical protein [Chroococcopsis gigantea SAG 12.99]